MGGSYKDEEEFKADGCYTDMVSCALENLNKDIKESFDKLSELIEE